MGAGIDYYAHDTRFANDYWDNGSQEISMNDHLQFESYTSLSKY